MADKSIGSLTLDTKKIDDAVKHVNDKLKELGVGIKVDLSNKVSAEVKKQLDGVLKEIEKYQVKMSDAVDKAINDAAGKAGKKVDDKNLKEAITLWKEYYSVLTKAQSATNSGKSEKASYLNNEAESIRQRAQALKDEAEVQEYLTAAKRNYNAVVKEGIDRSTSKTSAQKSKDIKDEQKAIEDATKAYIKLEEARSKARIAEDKYGKESEQYAKAAAEVDKAKAAYDRYSDGVKNAMMANQESQKSINAALDTIAKTENTTREAIAAKERETEIVRNAKQVYIEITDAIKNYNAAKKAGDETGMANAQARIDAAMQEVSTIRQAVEASNLEAGAKQQVLNYIQQCTTAEHQHTTEINKSVSSTNELSSQVNGLLMRYLSLMAVIRSISSLIQNMVDYVSEYSQKMNEIQMITLKTDDEVAQLADTYRALAKDMSVSSLDMADAAIYFTRQGLGAAEIEKRLKNVTMYAKAANVEFKDASEIVTAVVNSMGLVEQEAEDGRNAVERVADVFLKIGDNAATSGQEIGEAMQKAAASAGAFGVSMEWLAAYIATVSETTRQEARTIGTAFNTIIARLHQIKQTGYNQDDETKVNDIAKALSKIDVVLMDQAGNWRDMEDILVEIADKWSDLDGKTKSYIATTMAGVKQQNVFLALMNDMSKGVEGNSRAFELYNMALDSAGTAEEKYAVYLDSVEAAQNRLTVAQERFYSLLDENIIKGWTNAFSGYINMIVDGAEAWGDWTIILPVVVGVITAVAVAVKGLNIKLGETVTLMTLLESHPIMMAISAAILVIGTLITLISAGAAETETAEEKLTRINNTISESTDKVASYKKNMKELGIMMEDVGEDSKMTSDEIERYNGLLNDIIMISPKAAEAVEALKNNIGDQKEAFDTINEEIEKYIKNEQLIQALALSEKTAVKQEKTPSQQYAEFILQHGELSEMATSERFSIIEHGLSEDMQKIIEKLRQKDYSWEQIGRIMAEQFMDGMTASDYLAQSANELIDQYINVITMGMNNVDKDLVKKQLQSLVFGEDGILNFSEYENIQNVLQEFIDNAIALSFDPQELVGSRERIKAIGEMIFGEDFFDLLFGDQLDELISGGEADIYADKISEAISTLIEAGFSDIEIGNLLRNLDLSSWANAVEAMKQKLLSEIQTTAGVDGLGTALTLGDEVVYDPGMWDELDVSVLKLITDLMNAEVSFEEIQEAMNNSTSIDEFKERLNGLSEVLDEGGEEAKNYFEELTETQKQIDKLSGYIDDLESGNGIDFDDLLDLTKSHPEILATIGDLDALKKKLEELRGEASASKKSDLLEIMLDSTDLFKTRKVSNTRIAKESGAETYREYLNALKEAGFSDEYINAVIKGVESLVDDYVKMAEAANDAEEPFKKMLEDLGKYHTEIKTLDGYIEKIRDGKGLDASDFLNLAGSHEELTAYFGDLEMLKQKLIELREQTADEAKKSIVDELMKNSDFFKNSIFADAKDSFGHNFENMEEYMASLRKGSRDYEEASKYVDEAAENLRDGSEVMNDAAETWLAAQNKIIEANQKLNFAKSNNFAVQIGELQKALKSGNMERVLDTWYAYDEEMRKSIADMYPNLVRSLYEVEEAVRGADEETKKAYETQKARREEIAEEMQSLYPDSNADFLNRPVIDTSKLTAAGWGEQEPGKATLYSNDYWAGSEGIKWNQDVIISLTPITEDGDVLSPENLDQYIDELLAGSENIDELMANDSLHLVIGVETEFDSFEEAQKEVSKTNKELSRLQGEFYDTGKAGDKATKAANKFGSELERVQRFNNTKYFKDTVEAMKKLENGTITAAEAYDTYYKEVDKVSKAYQEIQKAETKLASGKALEISDVNDLASAIGKTTQEVLDDFPAALDMFDEMVQAGNETYEALNREAIMRITGIGEADFSSLMSGMVAVQDEADATVQMLLALGQFELQEKTLTEDMELPVVGKDGGIEYIHGSANAKYKFLVPKGSNPLGSIGKVGGGGGGGSSNTETEDSGGGGGGGGGNSNENAKSEIEKMLEAMEQILDLQKAQQNFYQAQQKFYEQTGQLQGVIAYMNKEKDALADQNRTLEENIKQIEAQMAAKSAELAGLSTSDEQYQQVADDLDKLQKAHQNYTVQLINNKTAVEQLTKAMEEQKKKIRQLEIDVENMILQAILDREQKKQDMLQAEIEMENKILEIIKKRYEKERDEIIETTNMKIDALNKEKELLDEQLRIRKEQAQEEDKLKKLHELEAQYQRIVADPTRAKEAKEIQKEIDELREEMAWDAAEKEVEAQKESIDKQIDNLEDYIEYVQKYYEDLFEHPKKLIKEMREILKMSEEDIINWLKENDEEYATATKNRRKQIEQGWKDTYDKMKGNVKTYWDEVRDIMSKGDDYIIEFLKKHSKDYREASKLQAEAYVDEWKKKLEDLKKAHEEVAAQVAHNYQQIAQAAADAGAGSVGGGGDPSGGSGGGTKWKASLYYNDLMYNAHLVTGEAIGANADVAKQAAEAKARNQIPVNNRGTWGLEFTKIYKKGGLANFTGPAWLDGSPQDPERVLSPYQTKLFETMVEALERVSTISVPGLPNIGDFGNNTNSNMSFGDIIVNVDNLDTDDDYEELAQKVSDIIMERIGKTTVVGGIRISS